MLARRPLDSKSKQIKAIAQIQLNGLFKISNTGCHRSTSANMQASTTTDETDITDKELS